MKRVGPGVLVLVLVMGGAALLLTSRGRKPERLQGSHQFTVVHGIGKPSYRRGDAIPCTAN